MKESNNSPNANYSAPSTSYPADAAAGSAPYYPNVQPAVATSSYQYPQSSAYHHNPTTATSLNPGYYYPNNNYQNQSYYPNNNRGSYHHNSYSNSYHQQAAVAVDPEEAKVREYLENYGNGSFGASSGGVNSALAASGSSSRASSNVAVPAPASSKAFKEINTGNSEGKKHFYRAGGTELWEDQTLADWDPNDFRIFCGDLGVEVNDEMLFQAFSAYPSLLRTKVIRDKRTGRTKGYGFVSFKDPEDYRKAMREMNGKYIGSRPVKLRKSAWKDRNVSSRQMDKIVKGKLNPY